LLVKTCLGGVAILYLWDSGKNKHSVIPFLLWFNLKILMVTWYKAKYNKAFQMPYKIIPWYVCFDGIFKLYTNKKFNSGIFSISTWCYIFITLIL
jgi:hypothetical protein